MRRRKNGDKSSGNPSMLTKNPDKKPDTIKSKERPAWTPDGGKTKVDKK